MSYNELTRRELQALCKQHGLPANKTNAVMAGSLASLLSDSKPNAGLHAQVITSPTATRSIKSRPLSKPERVETSLAALILASSEKPGGNGSYGTLLKKCRDFPQEWKPDAKSAVMFSTPTKLVDSTPLPNTTPLRRRKKSDAILQPGSEDTTSKDIAQDASENLRILHEEISLLNPIAVKKLAPEPQFAPILDAAVLLTYNEDTVLKELDGLISRKLQHQELALG